MFNFNKKKSESAEKPNDSEVILTQLKMMAQVRDESGDYTGAFRTYEEISKVTEDADTFYNLGVYYAMGRGVEQSFLTAAYYFKKACGLGDSDAEKLLQKAKLDYMNHAICEFNEQGVFDAMVKYANLIEPDKDTKMAVGISLLEYGNYMYSKSEFKKALKSYTVGAVYCNDADCRYNVAVNYYNGKTGDKNIAAALYWFNKAADGGVDDAENVVRQIIKDYQNSGNDIKLLFDEIVNACVEGSGAVPRDIGKAGYWIAHKICDV